MSYAFPVLLTDKNKTGAAFIPTSKRHKTPVALAVDEGEDEGSYCDEEDEITVTICQGESEGEREDGDEDEDGYDNLI
ncbi:hypothetical protein DPX16_18349 [Anabarilius grahami]|uniref:Uncharacterized protein n=1 Tax=Anabarilius grahami TaxID=495550 RepID=A0A3N0YFT8_ANAGA|nr:hypothetical protein DPX16_18349 [Anabarilius grahami]